MEITKEIEYPDVSFYQGVIDFEKIGKTAIFRAGQNIWVDGQFHRNRAEAVKRGMNWGVYWFYDDRVSPGAQATALLSLFSGAQAKPNMEIWCDWESTYNGRYGSVANVVAFMQKIEAEMPYAKVGLYTGYYWFMNNTHALLNIGQLNYLKNKPLWLAWYGPAAQVKIPRPWTQLTVWQCGTPARGAEFGVNTIEIDMNWFNGTTAEFNQRYGATVEPVPPIIGETMIQGKALVTVKIRTAPNGIETGQFLKPGDVIEADRHDMQWLHLTKINGVTVTGEFWSSAGSQQQYIQWQEVSAPVDPPVDPPTAGVVPFTLQVDGYKPVAGNLEPL